MSGRRGCFRATEKCGTALASDAALLASRRKQASFVLLVSVVLAVLAGCGQKGPLVLPDGNAAGAAAPQSSDDEEDDEGEAERAANGNRNGTENGTDGR